MFVLLVLVVHLVYSYASNIKNILLLFSSKRPRFDIHSESEIKLIFQTQSQNSSAKIALILDPLEPKVHQNPPEIFSSWNRIDDKSFYTSHQGIATSGLYFYSDMIQKTAVRLIESGIMGHLVDTRVLMLRKPERKRKRQKLLNAQDFLICLELFFVIYGFSVIAFVFELFLNSKIFRKITILLFLRKSSTSKKFEFAKIHEDKNNKSCAYRKLNSNLIKKFRIKSVKADCSESLLNVTMDVHQKRNIEKHLKVFGENVVKPSKTNAEKQKEFESIVKMLTTKAN